VSSDDERRSGGGGGLVGKKVKYPTAIIDPNSARADHDSRGLWRSRTVVCGTVGAVGGEMDRSDVVGGVGVGGNR